MNTSVPPVTVTTCECDLRTGKFEGCTIFFGFAISAPFNQIRGRKMYREFVGIYF
jgi:hypothetical protein